MSSVPVYYVEDGPRDAPALVLSSSLGTTHELWRPQVPALAQHFRVVRYDHRGHGRSPVGEGFWRIGDLGADVLALLDHLDVERTHFCGLSLGGMVGLWLAAQAPDRIDRLAVCSTAARVDRPDAWSERAATVRDNGVVAITEQVVAGWFTRGFTERKSGLVGRMTAMLAGTSDEGYAACCQAIQQLDLEPLLPQVEAPTLVLAGERDIATPPRHAKEIAAGIRDASLALVGDAAHLANLEQPKIVTDLLLEHFLASGPHLV